MKPNATSYRLLFTVLFIVVATEQASALIGYRSFIYSSLTTTVLSGAVALIGLLAPVGALVIVGFKLKGRNHMLRLCVWLCIAFGALVLLVGLGGQNMFAIITGALYVLAGVFSSRAYNRPFKKEIS